MIHAISLEPFHAPPLSLNRRVHWAVERRIRDQLHWIVRARTIGIGVHTHVTVWLRWQPKVMRRRDGDNPGPTLKPCIDELVACGVVPDDTTDYVTVGPLELLPADRLLPHSRLWLCVEDGDTEAAA